MLFSLLLSGMASYSYTSLPSLDLILLRLTSKSRIAEYKLIFFSRQLQRAMSSLSPLLRRRPGSSPPRRHAWRRTTKRSSVEAAIISTAYGDRHTRKVYARSEAHEDRASAWRVRDQGSPRISIMSICEATTSRPSDHHSLSIG